MKVTACAVFVLIAMAVCLDCVSADEEGSGPATNICSLTVPEDINSKVDDCVTKENMEFMDRLIEHANSTEDYRLAVKKLCDNVPNLRQCVADVTAASEGCLEGVEKTRYVLNVTFIETTMEVICEEDGVNQATIEEEQPKPSNRNANGTADVYSQCILNAMAQHALRDETNQDPNYVMKYNYLSMRDARDCVQGLRGQGHDALVDAGVTHMSNVLDRMKCVDTETGTQVLCKTVIDQQVSTVS